MTNIIELELRHKAEGKPPPTAQEWFDYASSEVKRITDMIGYTQSDADKIKFMNALVAAEAAVNSARARLELERPKLIPPNPLNQLGESTEPITTQIKKPENQGLILLAGLVAAAIIFN